MGKEKKHKKHKKHSKHKKAKRQQHTDSSESSDDWEEAEKVPTLNPSVKSPSPHVHSVGGAFQNEKQSQKVAIKDGVCGATMRDDWMTSSTLLDTVSGATYSRENQTKKRKLEEKRQDIEKREVIQKARELNPYLHASECESGILQKLQSRRDDGVADRGSSWIHKAYERAKQRAIDENVPLEDIVIKQWGSMAKLQALLKSASRSISCTQSSEKGTASGWRKNVKTQNSCNSEQLPRGCMETTAAKNPKDGKIGLDPKYQMKDTTAVTNKSEDEVTCDEEMTDKDGNFQKCTTGATGKQEVVPMAQLTEKEKNEIGAKLVRAELMGDDELVEKLKAQLEGRGTGGTVASRKSPTSDPNEREVLLTRTDKHGNLYPLHTKTNVGDSDNDSCNDGSKNVQRKRNNDLKVMIEDEHLTSVDDHQKMTAHLASKHMVQTNGLQDDEYYSVDDMFIKSKDMRSDKRDTKEKAVTDAILQKKRSSNCRFCLGNSNIAQHLIISIGTNVYLALPINASLTEGHCLIIPTDHRPAQTYLDEDVLQEVNKFKKTLKIMFAKQEDDVIFLETCKDVTPGKHHCVIECIPVPKEIGDMGPIYFKKAISESGSEWSSNKKVVPIESKLGVTRALPKGLPYFAVEFGVDGGFGHIIEEESFPWYFGKEIIGGMMDLEPRLWMKPRKESFEQHKRKVFSFNEMWKKLDG